MLEMKGASRCGVGLDWSCDHCRHLGRGWARWGQACPRARSAGASQGLGCTEASLSGWACVWVWTAEPLASSPPGAGPVSPGAEPGALGYRGTPAISAAPGRGLSRETGTVPSAPAAPSRGAPPAQGLGCPHAGPEPLFFQQLHLERVYLGDVGGKGHAFQSRRPESLGFLPWVGRSPGGGRGGSLQNSCLDGEAGGLPSVGSQRVKQD